MGLNPDAVGATGGPVERSWDSKDCLLYALGVGAGTIDPVNQELEFTTENSQNVQQKVLPTFPVIVGMGAGAMMKAGDIDFTMLVHGEQGVELHRPLPVEGTAVITDTIVGIYDKGSGGVVATEAEGVDKATGEKLFTTRASLFIRGAGGFGGDRGPSGKRNQPPERPADHEVTYQTRADQALLYRLSGDRNPLHSDPRFAEAAGFPKPILHGLCTYGFTGRALLHALCGGDPDRFQLMEGRFSSPVMPGDALTVRMWVEGGEAVFQTVTQDGTVVLDGGLCRFS
jgi:acyl dehydratase